jgi:hypothetical protein
MNLETLQYLNEYHFRENTIIFYIRVLRIDMQQGAEKKENLSLRYIMISFIAHETYLFLKRMG